MAEKGVNLEHDKNTGVKLNKSLFDIIICFIVNSSATVVSPNKGTAEKLAKLGQIREFFPYLCDSLI